ncbi:hypothetical protein F2P79_013921 [Pimephales promelas]|nr:hypothetical protein F2P79_013921 [Pimephales promelas]
MHRSGPERSPMSLQAISSTAPKPLENFCPSAVSTTPFSLSQQTTAYRNLRDFASLILLTEVLPAGSQRAKAATKQLSTGVFTPLHSNTRTGIKSSDFTNAHNTHLRKHKDTLDTV